MPFVSSKQSRACFATDGFGGKVDCKEWAAKTNYSNLPKKKPGIKMGMKNRTNGRTAKTKG